MTDAILTAARQLAEGAFTELRTVVTGLPGEALDWRPAGPETNSIAVLATHSMNSTRLLLHQAMGLALPERDRDAEFRATATDPAALLSLIDTLGEECLAVLAPEATVDWSGPRQRKRSDGTVLESSAGHALLHAVEHLRGHVDQASLTRHLWEERG
ncbi:MAG: hypothetical protein A2Z12_06640 [Actinobacteria bacterium RBG_16_68_21]|nr:MAG: hypothetical protein A2Z12_06640 [Actinobacteria bacterium RBG_16_68_21]